MSHTTALYDEHGQEIGYLIHDSDWSGETLVRWPQGETVLPGAIMQAILRLATNDGPEAASAAPLTAKWVAIFRSALDKAVANNQQATFFHSQGLDRTVFPGESYYRRKPNNGRVLTLTIAPTPLEPGWERES